MASARAEQAGGRLTQSSWFTSRRALLPPLPNGPYFGRQLSGVSTVLCLILSSLLANLALIDSDQPASAEEPGAPSYVPGEVLVRFDENAPREDRAAVRRIVGAELTRELLMPNWELLRLPSSVNVDEAVVLLRRSSGVELAQPNFLYRSTQTQPNDPDLGQQWGLEKIQAQLAWDITRGLPFVVAAVIDAGIDFDHPDLAPNVWTNAGEVGIDSSGKAKQANDFDDDGNGFKDDWRGWDFCAIWLEPPTNCVGQDNDPSEEADETQKGSFETGSFHGTHVAGILGARGNNESGIAGVSWHARIMAVRALNRHGWGRQSGGSGGTSSTVAEAITYAVRNGAKIVNGSLGGTWFPEYDQGDPAVRDAIASAPQALFVFSAGNGATSEPHDGYDLDETPPDQEHPSNYPCMEKANNVICVAASNESDKRWSRSNFGKKSVDLAAPGEKVISSAPAGAPNVGSGTSAATPFVSGVAALLWSCQPSASVAEIKDAILRGVDVVPAFEGKVWSNGRLNAHKALLALGCRAGFDESGKRTVSFGHQHEQANAVALQPDGKILLAGNSGPHGKDGAAVARLLPDGRLDPAFNGTGQLLLPFDDDGDGNGFGLTSASAMGA